MTCESQKYVLPCRQAIYNIAREYQMIQTIGMNHLGPTPIGIQGDLSSIGHDKVRHHLDMLSFGWVQDNDDLS